MADAVRFFFDPIRPWAYQTLRWARRFAAALGARVHQRDEALDGLVAGADG
ncbi:MAG TPA: hypothetical protein VM324_08215 [Egibacteraceae bacterium]|jgi:2-hydroxychromene-2-carboxylate isomerase|nr:hypothetical protein [Egibacteraceae bacterium]